MKQAYWPVPGGYGSPALKGPWGCSPAGSPTWPARGVRLLLSQRHLLVTSDPVLSLSPLEDPKLRVLFLPSWRRAAPSTIKQAGKLLEITRLHQHSQNPSVNLGVRTSGSSIDSPSPRMKERKIRNRGPILKDSIGESARCWQRRVGGERPIPTGVHAHVSPPRKTP